MASSKRGIVLAIIAFIVLIAAVYLTFFYAKSCSDKVCFNSALLNCQKAKFTNDAQDATWLYFIKGKARSGENAGDCRIDVTMLQAKQGTQEMKALEGKSMSCYLPLGIVQAPESDISKCHGLLKEEILEKIIITKMHAYILEHVGEVKEELTKI